MFLPDRGFSVMRQWWKSKKVWGTILSAGIILLGHREGWDPSVTRDVAFCLMGGVTVEGVIDAFSAYSRKGQ